MIRESKRARLATDDTSKVKVGTGSRAVLRCPLFGETLAGTDRKCATNKTQRLDQHLVNKHNLACNSDAFKHAFTRAQREADIREQRTDQTLVFDEIVRKYTNTVEGRSTGKKQTANISFSHRSALKLLLPDIFQAGLQQLMAAGDKDVYIDTIISEQKIKPKTLQVYLSSVRKFLTWLSQDVDTLHQLRLQHEFVQQVSTKLSLFSESLNEDVAKSEMNSGIEAAEEGQTLAPWMEAGSQDSQVVAEDIELANQAAYRMLTRSERCAVRNTLYLALTLDQIRRAGDVNCIRMDQAWAVLDQWQTDGCP
ncbi:MAG: hypothetical protein AB2693_15925, partial [Candidatus Thiodiazotropha sp.]